MKAKVNKLQSIYDCGQAKLFVEHCTQQLQVERLTETVFLVTTIIEYGRTANFHTQNFNKSTSMTVAARAYS